MRRRFGLCISATTALAAAACPSTPVRQDAVPAATDAPLAPGSATVEGRLGGEPFVPADAIVVRLPRKKGRGDIAWVVLSTAPDACQAYLDGSLHLELFEPRQAFSDSRFVVWTVFAARDLSGDLAVGPVGHGIPAFEGPSPLPPPGPGPYGFAQAGGAGPQCQEHEIPFTYPTMTSEFAITAVGAADQPLAATFHLADGNGATELRGTFNARPCQPPRDTPTPRAPACRPAPAGPRTTPEAQAAAARFAPLGEPIAAAGICWEAELSCIAESGDDAPGAADAREAVRRVELARPAFKERKASGVPAFPEAPGADDGHWVSHYRGDGNGGSLVQAVTTDGARRVYTLGNERFAVDLVPGADGFFRATFETPDHTTRLVCQRPSKLAGDQARWRYSEFGDCP